MANHLQHQALHPRLPHEIEQRRCRYKMSRGPRQAIEFGHEIDALTYDRNLETGPRPMQGLVQGSASRNPQMARPSAQQFLVVVDHQPLLWAA